MLRGSIKTIAGGGLELNALVKVFSGVLDAVISQAYFGTGKNGERAVLQPAGFCESLAANRRAGSRRCADLAGYSAHSDYFLTPR